uniref:Uncharacterized protein n=1 Tax=Rhizophora mucronata TaxID=61149 RepID=A0A2P2Q0N2_RHIMU
MLAGSVILLSEHTTSFKFSISEPITQ